MADRFDAMRFSGPIGTLLAETQERVLAEFLGPVDGRRILDVGTGTGRAALALARRGARVTGIDASQEMLRVAKGRAVEESLSADFEVGDAHRLAFRTERSWRLSVSGPDAHAGLARVPWRVVPRGGRACRVRLSGRLQRRCVSGAGRRLAAALGRPVEAYRVLRARDVRRAVRACGFRVEREHRQFVLPIALHKAAGSRSLTMAVERALAAIGLLRLVGSPVTVVAVRCAR